MWKKEIVTRNIFRIWGNKILLFLFLLNLLTNSTLLVYPPYNTFYYICNAIAISALFATVEGILYFLLRKIHLNKVFLALVVFLHLSLFIVDVFLYKNFNFLFGQNVIDILAQTTSNEAKSFLSTYVSFSFVLGVVVAVICVLWLFTRVAKWLSQRKAISIAFASLTFAGVIIYGITILNFVLYHNGQSIPQLHSFTRSAYASTVLLNRHRQIVTLREVNSNVTVSKPSKGVQTIIVVIGESFSSYHSSLYGYSKETNPLLAKRVDNGSLTVFSDVVTFADHTETVMCSVFPLSTQPETFFTDVLFPVCFRAAGYHTSMLDNQYFVGNGITFLTDEVLSSLMFDSRNTDGYDYDGEMLGDIHLEQRPQLIVLHLQGQHYTYSDRYPEAFARFSPKDYTGITESQKEIVAHYDNATLYNDYVIDQLIESVKERDCIVVYFSDHGEELFEVDDYIGHGNAALRSDLSYQIKVPLFMWVSDSFQQKHSEMAKRIKESADKPLITSDLPHFLLDVAGIETDQFHPEQSFINDYYKSRKRIVLNSIDYDAKKNELSKKARYK